ncbi:MAG TPA: hypothetical protein VL947_09435 [Cytophagales bacterium]|nr:hypothetical protein [Cytophagales bacterium]
MKAAPLHTVMLLLLSWVLCVGCCEKRELPQRQYQVTVGQYFQIPFRTDPCCYSCWANAYDAKAVRFLEKKVPCHGCPDESAFVFKAYARGVDTIKLRMVHTNGTCDSSLLRAETHIVEVR